MAFPVCCCSKWRSERSFHDFEDSGFSLFSSAIPPTRSFSSPVLFFHATGFSFERQQVNALSRLVAVSKETWPSPPHNSTHCRAYCILDSICTKLVSTICGNQTIFTQHPSSDLLLPFRLSLSTIPIHTHVPVKIYNEKRHNS